MLIRRLLWYNQSKMDEENAELYNNTMEVVDVDESKLCEVAKHPFGIIVFYIQVFIGVFIALGLTFFLLPSVIEDTDRAFSIAIIVSLVAVVLATMMVAIATMVYRQNRLIVTNRNITQILQYGLFNRKVSQLNLVNVEDVTSVHNGIFANIFGYGVLKIETAGEQANFHFTYCPRASYYAKVILNAREKILGQHDDDHTVEPGVGATR